MRTNGGGPALAGEGLVLVTLLAVACAAAPPKTPRPVEAPQYRLLLSRPLKVRVLDRANLLKGDALRMEDLVAGISRRLAEGGVTVASDAANTLVLEFSSSQRPAQGEAWCVHVAGWVDSGQPAFLPHRQWVSERCAAITRVEQDAVSGLVNLLAMGIQEASGSLSRERSERYAATLADCIEDVLGQLDGVPSR